MAGYILTERNVHKCPSDKFQSPQQRTRGWHRVRSVAMNSTLGDGNAMLGPWDSLYRQARSISDLYLPTPAETTVLFDEHPDSINDPLVYAPRQNNWIDIPGNLHDGAGSFSFADGHVALRQWRTSTIRNLPVRFNFTTLTVRTGDPDITWMSYTSQRSRDHTY
jgi:prepilin-type processing-associated H-X9-DG protein